MKEILIKNTKKTQVNIWIWRKTSYQCSHSTMSMDWTHATFHEEKKTLTFFLNDQKITKIDKSLDDWFTSNCNFCDYFDLPAYLRDKYDNLNGIQVINRHISLCNAIVASRYRLKMENSVPSIVKIVKKETTELEKNDFDTFITEFRKRAITHHTKIKEIRSNQSPHFLGDIKYNSSEDKEIIKNMIKSLKYVSQFKEEPRSFKDVSTISKIPENNKNLSKQCKTQFPSIRMASSRSREDYLVEQVLKILDERTLIKNLEEIRDYVSLDIDGVSIVINIPNYLPLSIPSGGLYFELLKLKEYSNGHT